MQTGAITGYIDVAQLVLYGFWIFFAGLVIYLRREDKREGYPLESDRSERARNVPVQGFPAVPSPKTFRLAHGGTAQAPSGRVDEIDVLATSGGYPGSPLEPTGNPMLDAVGPASYAKRATVPDQTIDGAPRIVPMRVATEFSVESRDPDPRGWTVAGLDGVSGGKIVDIWVDRSEPQIRYYEVQTNEATPRRVLLPVTLVQVRKTHRYLRVDSITGAQFAGVPGLSQPDQVTLREEDQISAYYAGGTLYATPARSEPLL